MKPTRKSNRRALSLVAVALLGASTLQSTGCCPATAGPAVAGVAALLGGGLIMGQAARQASRDESRMVEAAAQVAAEQQARKEELEERAEELEEEREELRERLAALEKEKASAATAEDPDPDAARGDAVGGDDGLGTTEDRTQAG